MRRLAHIKPPEGERERRDLELCSFVDGLKTIVRGSAHFLASCDDTQDSDSAALSFRRVINQNPPL